MSNIEKYIERKCTLLYQCGLIKTNAVRQVLHKASLQSKQPEISIDNMARKLIMSYHDGDRTYVR